MVENDDDDDYHHHHHQQQQQQQQWCWSQQREKELELTAKIAETFPKNYYAWTHRWWVVGSEDRGMSDVHREEKGVTLNRSWRISSREGDEIDGRGEEKEEEAALWQEQVEFAQRWAGRH
eukprot:evm.model.NODE_50181_length_8072_cov_31.917368.1